MGLTQPLVLERVGGHPTAVAQGLDFSSGPVAVRPSARPIFFRHAMAGLVLPFLGEHPKEAGSRAAGTHSQDFQ